MFETILIRTDDGAFFRCSRLPINDDEHDPTVFMNIFLIDTGENFILKILDVPDGTFFELPEAMKEVAGLAIKCQCNEIEIEHQFESQQSFLANNLYRKFTFEVVNVMTGGELKVDIMPYDESSINEDPEAENPHVKSNKDCEQNQVQIQLKPILNKEDGAVKKEMMTEEELEIWNEEPLNTGNAQVAVQGFSTRDDERLCKFYDPTIGGCFKGGRCKQRHRLEIKDGSCRDQIKIYFNDISKILPSPVLHSTVKIEITSFYDVSKFLCRYAKLKNVKGGSDLETLIDHMNEEEETKNFTQLTYYPSIHQLVIFKSSDDKFYRARVKSLQDDKKTVELLLVDLGLIEKAQCNRIFNWSTRFNYLSFQAIEMEIANIQPLPRNTGDREGIAIVLDYLNQSRNSLKAVIFENVVGIKVKLFNTCGEDIGQELVDRKLAAEKVVDLPTLANFKTFIPG
jgi:Tudor domain